MVEHFQDIYTPNIWFPISPNLKKKQNKKTTMDYYVRCIVEMETTHIIKYSLEVTIGDTLWCLQSLWVNLDRVTVRSVDCWVARCHKLWPSVLHDLALLKLRTTFPLTETLNNVCRVELQYKPSVGSVGVEQTKSTWAGTVIDWQTL